MKSKITQIADMMASASSQWTPEMMTQTLRILDIIPPGPQQHDSDTPSPINLEKVSDFQGRARGWMGCPLCKVVCQAVSRQVGLPLLVASAQDAVSRRALNRSTIHLKFFPKIGLPIEMQIFIERGRLVT